MNKAKGSSIRWTGILQSITFQVKEEDVFLGMQIAVKFDMYLCSEFRACPEQAKRVEEFRVQSVELIIRKLKLERSAHASL